MTGPLAWPEPPDASRRLRLEEIIRPIGSCACVGFADERGARHVVTYDELARLVARAAAGLRRHGVEPGRPVAITLRNALPDVIAALGVWAAGGVLVSVPPRTRTADRLYGERFRVVLDAMDCRHHVVGNPSDPAIGPAIRVPLDDLEGSGPATDPEQPVPDVALVQFTSGSLGDPKGVAINRDVLAGHLDLVGRCLRMDAAEDTVATWLPMFHDLGFVCFFGSALCARVAQIHAEPRAFVRNPAMWMRLLAAERATITGAPNFGYRLAGRARYPSDMDLSRLKCSLNAAERVLWPDLEDFHAAVGPLGFRWEAVMPAYGLAEGTVGVTCTPFGRGPVRGSGGHVSVGTPLPGNRIAVLGDARPGRLHLDSDWLFDGYWTPGGFVARTSTPFDTDDAGFLDGGELYVVGRCGDVASIGGHNVFAEDVEAVAIDSSEPSALGCAAFTYDSDLGERMALVVEIARGDGPHAPIIAQAVRAAVSEALGTRVTPVLVARAGVIPRTTSGKPRRAQLRADFLAGDLPQAKVYVALS